jgi:DnaJ-class molecular chaperone
MSGRCPKCNGKGYVSTSLDFFNNPDTTKCPSCGGSGKRGFFGTCSTCGGLGYITRSKGLLSILFGRGGGGTKDCPLCGGRGSF